MGMFDSVMMTVTCPYCKVRRKRELQTKDLRCCLDVYKVGDKIPRPLTELDCITDCLAPKCLRYAKRRDKEIQGCFSGFGRPFTVTVKVKRGKITNDITVKKKED